MANSTMIDRYGHTSEEAQALKRQIEAVNAEAYANRDNPVWRKEMAADLTETIYWGFQHENLLSQYTQVENVDFNGRSRIVEVRGLRAFWVARGGHIEASDMHEETFEIQRDTLGFHVFTMEDKIRTQFGETQANLVNLGIQRMDAEVNLRVLAAFQASIQPGSPYYISANGLSLPALNLALRQVRDTSMDFQLTLLGRSTMTDQIIDALMGTGGNTAGFFPETNERLLEQGVIGVYRGARIVTLKNYRDDTDAPFFPANELWVIGRDASKFGPVRQRIAGCGADIGQALADGIGTTRIGCIRTSRLSRESMLRGVAFSDAPRRFFARDNFRIAAGTWPALRLDEPLENSTPGG